MVYGPQSRRRGHHGKTFTAPYQFKLIIPPQPSPRVAIVKFRHGIRQGIHGRISRDGVREYHAFGIISESPESSCHYMIVGVQGDWTSGIAKDPPKVLYTRKLRVCTFFPFRISQSYFLLAGWSSLPRPTIPSRNYDLYRLWHRWCSFYLSSTG